MGGGSGHEPAHSGFVQEGMLTAAVCGDIYSSPSFINIQKAIDLIYSPRGVILLIKNYGGDIINFSLAAEIAKSQGKKVEILIVDDDISLTNLNEVNDDFENKNEFNKRRGLCGIVYLYKILGSMSKENYSFEEILEFGKNIIPSLYTLGVSLTSSVTPFSCKEDLIDEIKCSECEIGLGIHGEKGKERISYDNIDNLIVYCFKNVFEKNMKKEFFTLDLNDNKIENERSIIIVLNNLGSCTDIEMNIIFKSLKEYIEKIYNNKIKVLRYFCGKFMVSLDMKGFSITICNMNENGFLKKNKQNILYHLDAELKSNIFNSISTDDDNYKKRIIIEEKSERKVYENKNSLVKNLLFNLCKYLISKCDYLNHLDKEVADGDLGIGVERGCSSILKNLDYLNFEENFKLSIKEIGNLIGSHYGGTSGPLIASFLIGGSEYLIEKETSNIFDNWFSFFSEGTKIMQNLGKAKLNDKTMLDVLIPIGILLEDIKEDFNNCNNIFKKDFEKKIKFKLDELLKDIKNMKSKKGRSSYQDGKEVGKDDPGCILINLIIRFILDFIINNN